MEKLTVQIITKNNELQIGKAINSIQGLNCRIIVADLGSHDETPRICEKYGVEVLNYKDADRSIIRNRICLYAGTIWHFYLEPWETLIKGHEEIRDICNTNLRKSYYLKLYQSNTISRDIRLWQTGLLFENPVFECISDNKAAYSNAILSAQRDPRLLMSEVEAWRKQDPTSSTPYYFEACLLLASGNHQGFLRVSDQFLFRETNQLLPIVMTRYYRAITFARIKHDPEQAIRNLLPCLISQPLHAEFWCLLGDVYYHLLKQFSKARVFYQNALDLGKKRSKNDPWPIEIDKYRNYPTKMIGYCEHKINKVEFYKKS